MKVAAGILRYEVEQHHQDGMYLGRHLELDGRSLAYALTPEETQVPIKPAEWLAPIPTLDQGNVGSCVGNAATRLLAQIYGTDLAQLAMNGVSLGADPASDEKFALQVYHLATVADGFRGTYPPDDTGSSGLGAARAMKKVGAISSYKWATNPRAWATLLQHSGCIAGVPWYSAWFHPNSDGFVDSGNWRASGVAGGHEIYLEAIEAWDDADLSKCIIRFHNSWGNWGDNGCGRMRLSTLDAVRSQVDVKTFVR